MNELRTIFNRMKSADFHRNIRICESICHGKSVNEVMEIYDLSKNRVIQVYQKMMNKCIVQSQSDGISFRNKDDGIKGLTAYPEFWLGRFSALKVAYQEYKESKGN